MKIQEGLVGLTDILQRKLKNPKKPPAYRWQEQALEALKYFVDGSAYKKQVFRCYKLDAIVAHRALVDCKELNKPYTKYFLKVFNIHRSSSSPKELK